MSGEVGADTNSSSDDIVSFVFVRSVSIIFGLVGTLGDEFVGALVTLLLPRGFGGVGGCCFNCCSGCGLCCVLGVSFFWGSPGE